MTKCREILERNAASMSSYTLPTMLWTCAMARQVMYDVLVGTEEYGGHEEENEIGDRHVPDLYAEDWNSGTGAIPIPRQTLESASRTLGDPHWKRGLLRSTKDWMQTINSAWRRQVRR